MLGGVSGGEALRSRRAADVSRTDEQNVQSGLLVERTAATLNLTGRDVSGT